MVIAGGFSGALAGLLLASIVTNQIWLAIDAAFAAVFIALVVQQIIVRPRVRLHFPRELYFLHVVVATLIGGLAGHELAIDLKDPPASPLIGATSGLLASVLISCFLITASYRRNGQAHN
jgi:predicted branched-subunit amino acid permease